MNLGEPFFSASRLLPFLSALFCLMWEACLRLTFLNALPFLVKQYFSSSTKRDAFGKSLLLRQKYFFPLIHFHKNHRKNIYWTVKTETYLIFVVHSTPGYQLFFAAYFVFSTGPQFAWTTCTKTTMDYDMGMTMSSASHAGGFSNAALIICLVLFALLLASVSDASPVEVAVTKITVSPISLAQWLVSFFTGQRRGGGGWAVLRPSHRRRNHVRRKMMCPSWGKGS